MKKLLVISIALVLMLALVGCGQNETEADMEESAGAGTEVEEWQGGTIVGCPAPDLLVFSSLEEFLLSYMTVKNGARAEGFVPASFHGNFERFSEMAESVDLLSLERFYLPINIPEEYKIYSIDIFDSTVGIWFLPEELLGSQNALLDAMLLSQYFLFSFTRDFTLVHGLENPMAGVMEQHGVTEANLIDGKYLFRAPNRFRWAMDNELFGLHTPSPHIVGFSDAPEDMVQFTEVYVLDLTDEDAIKAILVNLPSQHP
jgi:hypothetical protein